MDIIRKEVEAIDDLVLVLVDTAAAYFPGTETNSNSEQGAYARLLREMTFLKEQAGRHCAQSSRQERLPGTICCRWAAVPSSTKSTAT